jgi:hypothetical protein
MVNKKLLNPQPVTRNPILRFTHHESRFFLVPRPSPLVPCHFRPLSQFKRDFQNTLTNFKVAAKLRAVKEDGGVGLAVSQTFRRRGADG